MSMACMKSMETDIINMINREVSSMSMYRNRTQWSTATDKELLEKFRQLSAATRIPASRLLDEAIEDLLVKYNVITKEEKKNP